MGSLCPDLASRESIKCRGSVCTIVMEDQPDFSEKFETALDEEGYGSHEIHRLESRECISEQYEGVQYSLYGTWVAIRPLIDVISEQDGFKIETINFVNENPAGDDYEACLSLFVADVRDLEQDPAFTSQ